MLYLLLAVFIWASAFIAGKFTYEIMDPILMVQLRLCIPALLLLPLFIKNYPKIPHHLRPRIWLLALLNFPVVFILQFMGLYYTSAASAVTMLGAEPLIVVLVGYLFFHCVAGLIDWLLSLVALIGIAIMVSGSETGGDINLWGCLLVLGSGTAFAFCIYLSKQIMKEIKPSVYSNSIIVLGTLLCVPFTLLFVRDWTIIPTLKGLSALFYLGLGCTWLAVLFWNKGLQTTDPTISSLINTLEPVFGVLLAIFILGEQLSSVTTFGVLLVISATIISVLVPIWKKFLRSRLSL